MRALSVRSVDAGWPFSSASSLPLMSAFAAPAFRNVAAVFGFERNLERFGIVHLFALVLVTFAHAAMLVQRHP
ncbi:hypothetical protein WMF12_00820 [Sorangium sp. So ce363]